MKLACIVTMVSQSAKRLRKKLKNNSKLEREKTKEEVIQVFKSNGLKITIVGNKNIVNLFDVTFNLTKGSFKPYMKPNNELSYFHQQSNQPQNY